MVMARKRIWLYAAVLFVLTGTILATQVSWIVQSANIEESFLNQRVNMALCSAMDVLSKDKGMCSSLESCTAHSANSFELTLTRNDKQKIDSVILQHLLFYNISIPFQTTFSPYPKGGMKEPLESGQALLFPVSKAGMQNVIVQLEIPSKNDLIRAQVNGTFLLSLVMLVLLTVIFFSALRALDKERAIRKETVDLVNTMAHDLKTPISNISFALSLFTRENPDIKTSSSQYISIINTETSQLKQRARQILGIASVDALLEEKSNKTQVDLHDLINQAVASFSLRLRETNGEINAQLEATRHIVSGNQAQLASALTNIIDNAIIYANGCPIVTIKTENVAGSMIISISDNGPGIPDDEKELVFKKGYRIHNGKSKTEGFGMGLYLAKTLIHKQGGGLSLFSEGSNGSKFIISLPVK
jgi:signal transduction histidine kinase